MSRLPKIEARERAELEVAAAEHTPGPWAVVPGNEHHGFYVEEPSGSTVCDLYFLSGAGSGRGDRLFEHLPKDAEANARLIAAAPELLEALKDALDVLDIAEAYGLYAPGSLGEADILDSRNMARAAIAKATRQ